MDPKCLWFQSWELGGWVPGGVLLATTCVTWAKCSSALDFSFIISKMRLGPVELVSCFSFMWMRVEEGPFYP